MPLPLSRRIPGPLLCLGCLLALVPLAASERPPVADFARAADIRHLQLSPDGGSLAFLRDYDGRTHLCVLNLAEGATTRFRIGEVDYNGSLMPKEVDSFKWVSDRRLVLNTKVWGMLYGAAAVDRDGKNWRGLTGHEFDPSGRHASPAFEVLHTFRGDEPRVLMLDRRGPLGAARLHPDVLEVNTATGLSKVVLKNPGNVIAWMSDDQGVIRLGIARDGDDTKVQYRESARGAWRTLPLPSRGHEKLRPLGFDPFTGSFYVAGFNAEDRWTVFPYDLTDGSRGPAVVSDPVYDTLGGSYRPSYSGLPLTRPLFSEAQQRLIGIAYVAVAPRVHWLDPEFARIQAAVDRSLPHTVNLLVNASRDDQRLLFLSYSDRQPGIYHLLDRRERTFKPVGQAMDWIDPARMSPMHAIHYPARDGTTIHGYLTVPVGHEPRDLPLIVLPHGGPWVRDVWGFDPLVQLIASRGYAVLQMNYRGSRGYGSAFEMLGQQQVGRGIQTDIEDAAHWAVAAGVADPARLAIAGASYGGYSALFALGQSAGLYRCGISLNGVTDWLEIFGRSARDPAFAFARRHWTTQIGDPTEDEDFLRAISPVNFAAKITAPVLIIQARDDRTVPAAQARMMSAALAQAGHPTEVVYLREGGHSLATERVRLEAYTALVDFLEQHLGPGVPFQPQP